LFGFLRGDFVAAAIAEIRLDGLWLTADGYQLIASGRRPDPVW
jgi:hypothetical protein